MSGCVLRRLSCVCLLWLVGISTASAQTPAGGAMRGVVRDEQGGVLPGVSIVAASGESAAFKTVSDREGFYRLVDLPPGTYALTAELPGFATLKRQGLVVDPGVNLALDLDMKVESVTEAVIVTAQKQGEELLRDVPIPVAVISAQQLVSNSQPLLRDYYATVPGLSVAPIYLGRQELSIRGVMTGGQSNPTVGITIDDVPYGASTVATGGPSLPDIDPGDLARLEVLRGPQGTLYGANSMGGLIKYVTIDPTFAGRSGRVEFGTNGVYNGDEPGYSLRAVINVPLSRTWAIRASGFTRQDPGYVDNPVLHIDGVNKAVAGGGRLAMLWQPSPDTSLKLNAMYQRTESDGSAEVQSLPGLGDLQQNFLAGTRGYEKNVQAYSALLRAKIGGLALTSVTGYSFNDFAATDDRGYAYGAAVQSAFGVSGIRYLALNPTRKITQEFRASAPIGRRLEWLAGAFYTREHQLDETTMVAEDTITGRSAGLFFHYNGNSTFDEYAGFADLTYHVTDRLDIQVGGRQSRPRVLIDLQTTTGPATTTLFGRPSPVITPRTESKMNAFTYLVTPKFALSPNQMVYGRLASGYRPGSPNSVVAIANGAPTHAEPDKTRNYEVGFKGDFLDGDLAVDASLYYIDWIDIQIGLRSPVAIWSDNGGTAKSQGVEFTVTGRPTRGLTVTASAAFDDAALTKPFPSTSTAYGSTGNRLPFATRSSAYVSAEHAFPLANALLGVIGGGISYVGDRIGIFQATPLRQYLPAYTKIDLRAGIKRNVWMAQLYVNNVTDERGLINGGIGYIPANAFSYIQPRTVGLSVSRSF